MFVPLHVKSHFSAGEGTATIEELVAAAAARDLRALALTDVENLYGQVRFHHAAKAAGLRAISGVELRGPRPRGDRPRRGDARGGHRAALPPPRPALGPDPGGLSR